MKQETTETQPPESTTAAQLVIVGQLRRELTDLMRIEVHEIVRPPDAVIAFRGKVHGDTETAFERMTQRFATHGYTPWLRDQPGGRHEVIATKGAFERKPGRRWINVALFLVTLLSVLYIGALNEHDPEMLEGLNGLELLITPLTHLHWGFPFAGTLLGILLAHELSHYYIARRYGSPVSLPYFIPMPFSIIGTMGALIVQRAPMRNRKALFDIGIAGPLGGLIVAIPLLILGLALSDVGPPPPDLPPNVELFQEGNSLLYLGLKYIVFGRILPSNGEDVWLHSVAFAGWAGLLVTMINLIPVGQLDGGHAAYALLGRRAWTFGYVAIGAMVAWGGWMTMSGNEAGGFWITWSFLNMVLNRRHPPPLDDATKLGWPRIGLGLLMLLIFILLFMPAPLQTIPAQ